MNRLTTEIPQNNFEMVMNYVYDKNHEAFIRSDGEKDDVSLCEYIDKLCKAKGCDIAGYPTDERCCDCSMDGDCPIAMMYIFASQAVQLRGRLRAYEDTGLTPKQVQKLANAQNEGRLVVLPCKVGDTVYVLMQRNVTTDVVKGTVSNVRRYSDNTWQVEFSDLWVDKTFDDFGKTVFLTCEAAEKALKECEAE